MKVTINNKYALIIEKECAYIFFAGNIGDLKDDNTPMVSYIPPFLGFILSYFNGNEMDETLDKISQKFKINIGKLKTFVNNCFQNENAYISEYNGIKTIIPPFFLTIGDVKSKIRIASNAAISDKFNMHRLNYPAYLNIMITSKCLANCIYCYADRSRKDDMKQEEIFSLIENAHKTGIINVNISGGDIFAVNDWKQILKKLSECSYSSLLSTKIPLDDSDIAYLKSLKINKIQFSLDSINSNTIHTLLRLNGQDYLKKFYKSIEAFEKYDVKLDIKTVLTRYNDSVENITEMYNLFSKFKCISSWNIMPAFKSEYKCNFNDYRYNREKINIIYQYLSKLHPNFEVFYKGLQATHKEQYLSVDEFLLKNKICSANNYSLSVLSNGMATFCEMLYYNDFFYVGDVKKQTISEIWNSEKSYYFYRFENHKTTKSKCNECRSSKVCKFGSEKKICVADIVKAYGSNKWDYPDPRCPQAKKIDLETII